MLLLYIHFILQELCPQNGSIHLQEPHNGDGQKNFTVTVKDATRSHIYLGRGLCCEAPPPLRSDGGTQIQAQGVLKSALGGRKGCRREAGGECEQRWEAVMAERGARTSEAINQLAACCSRAK